MNDSTPVDRIALADAGDASRPSDRITVSDVKRLAGGGFTWTVATYEPVIGEGMDLEYERVESSYCTNEHGEGLWVWAPTGAQHRAAEGTLAPEMGWRQLRGTTQLRLAGIALSTRRERVLREALSGRMAEIQVAEGPGSMTARRVYADLPRA